MNPQLSNNPQRENTTEKISVGELLTLENTLENPAQYDNYKDVLLSPAEQQDFLSHKMSPTDLALKQRDQNSSEYLVGKNIDKANTIANEGDEEAISSQSEAEQTVNTAIESISNSNFSNLQEQGTNLQKTIENSIDSNNEGGILNKISKYIIGKLIAIFAFFGSIGNKISTFFNPKQQIESTIEDGKDVLQNTVDGLNNGSKEFDGIKKEVTNTITTDIKLENKYRHPAIQQRLEDAINNPDIFSAEDLQKLIVLKENNNAVRLADIDSILGPEKYALLFNEIINEDTNNELRMELEKELLDKIYDEYGINATDTEKRQKAGLIVKDFLSDVNLTQNEIIIERLKNGETITVGNLTDVLSKSGFKFGLLILKLTAAGVIDAESLLLQFVDGGKEMLVLSIPGIDGMISSVSKEELESHFKTMPPEQRSLMLAMLYRKTGLIAKLLGDISAFSLRSLVELGSSSSKSSIVMMKNSLFSNQAAKINTFKELEKILGGSAGAKLLDNSIRWTNTVTTNYSIIQTIEGKNLKSAYDSIKALKGTNVDDNFLDAILKYDINKPGVSIEDFRKSIANQVTDRISSATTVLDNKSLRDFPLRAEELRFQNNMKSIVKYQTQAIKGGVRSLPAKSFAKLGEILGSSQVPRNIDKLTAEANFQAADKLRKTNKNIRTSQYKPIEKGALITTMPNEYLMNADSITEASTKMQALKKLAIDSPELLRASFSAVPTLAFIGLELSMNDDESKSKMAQLLDSMWYITNVIGPVKLIMDMGAAYKDGQIQWHEVSKGGVGMVLLGLDIKNMLNIASKSNSTLELGKNLGAYMIRPVTDIGKFGIQVGKLGMNFADIIRGSGKFEMTKIMSNLGKNGKKVPTMLKNLPKKGKFGLATTAAIGGYLAFQGFLSENPNEVIVELQAQGILDDNGNLVPGKLQSLSNDLTDEQKTYLAQTIFISHADYISDNYYDISFKNGKIQVEALSDEVGEWFLSGQPELLAALEMYFPIKQSDIQFIPYQA